MTSDLRPSNTVLLPDWLVNSPEVDPNWREPPALVRVTRKTSESMSLTVMEDSAVDVAATTDWLDATVTLAGL